MVNLRVGVLGAGYIAAAHVGAYASTPGVELVVIADPAPGKAERLAQRVGARPCTNVGELFEAGLDAVSVCTPSPTHGDLTVRALDAGMHVLCEKPIARNVDEAERIRAADESSTSMLMIGHVSRFEPDHARAQQLVAAGRLGDLHLMKQSITSGKPTWSEDAWLDDPAQSGGPVVDLAIHSFDYLAWVNRSQPIRITANAVDTNAGPATYALITLRYANGAVGVVETSWAHPASHGFAVSTELAGASGRLNWDYAGLQSGAINTSSGRTAIEPLGSRGFVAEIAAFVDAIRMGKPSPVSAYEGLAALRTSLAALESIRTGVPIEMPLDADDV